MDVPIAPELVETRLKEGTKTANAGVVHQYVEPPKMVDRACDSSIDGDPIGNVSAINERDSAIRLDLAHCLLGRRRVRTIACAVGAKIIHDDLCSAISQRRGIGTAKTATCAGYECDFSG